MATSKLMLNKARRLNDGTYPLVMQVIHQRQKRVIYSKIYLCKEEFDEQNGIVVPSSTKSRTPKELKVMNRTISEFRQHVEQVISCFDESGLPYSVKDVAQKYRILCGGGSFYSYWQKQIEQLEFSCRHGTADAQRNTLRSVVRFYGSQEISFPTINNSFLHAYQANQLSCKVSPNTIAYYMRNFKSIVNRAIREGRIPGSGKEIFKGIDMAPKKTVKRALTREELRSLLELDLGNEPELELARDLFLFSYYTRGMAFVDIAFLKKENISGDIISYARHKTKQFLRVGINTPIRLLINKYHSVSQYIFPVICSIEPQAAYREYRRGLRLANLRLKTVGQRAVIRIALTTYCARHSWATQAKERGASVSVISEGLGHTSEQITRIYLRDFDQSVLDRVNDQVSEL